MISTLGIILLSSILLVITEAGCLKIARKQTQNDLMMGGYTFIYIYIYSYTIQSYIYNKIK